MKKNNKYGFTLVELLAVIVILGLILVITVPKVTQTINNSKKRTLELTVRSIAKTAEEKYIENDTFGLEEEITCESISGISNNDYSSCNIVFDEEGNARVTITGSGKFAGLYVCNGTKIKAEATNDESCIPAGNATTFEDDDWATIVAAVKSGNHPYEVGNTKTVDMGTLGTHTLRVANTTPCEGLSITSQTACGFVLEFADVITTYKMNPAGEYNGTQYGSGTNIGGWPASAMRKYINDIDTSSEEDGVIYNALPEELRAGIINTYVVSSHGSNTTAGNLENENAGVLESSNYWSNDKLYLLSPQEVYGTSFTNQYDSTNGTSRQLDYYAEYKGEGYTGVSTTNYAGAIKNNSSGRASYWWLRSANSNTDTIFYDVGSGGYWSDSFAYMSSGVSPVFRIAE